MQDVLLAAVDVAPNAVHTRGMNASSKLRPFVCSFLSHVPRGRLVLFVHPAAAVDEVHAGIGSPSRATVLPIDSRGWIQLFRYAAYAAWLSIQADVRHVAVSDATDVVFQSDPFAHIHDGSDLVFSGEVSCIGCNTGNKYWVRNLYGSDVLKALSHEPGSCSGFTMGGGRAMGSYLRRMADEIERKLVPRLPAMAHENLMLAKGYDQGVHNVMLRDEFVVRRTTSGPAASRADGMTAGDSASTGSSTGMLGTARRSHPELRTRLLPVGHVIMTAYRMVAGQHFILNGSTVIGLSSVNATRRREPFAVVHQYNRLIRPYHSAIRLAAEGKCAH